MILTILAYCAVTFAVAVTTTGTAHAVDCSEPMQCVGLRNLHENRWLEMKATHDGAWFSYSDPHPELDYSAWRSEAQFSLNTNDDGTFQIKSVKTGMCAIAQWHGSVYTNLLWQEPCQSGKKAQLFYIQPYKSWYMIRQVQNTDSPTPVTGNCLDLHWETWYGIGSRPCTDNLTSDRFLWSIHEPLGTSGRYMALAAKYGLAKCKGSGTNETDELLKYCKLNIKDSQVTKGPEYCYKDFGYNDNVTGDQKVSHTYWNEIWKSKLTGRTERNEVGAYVKATFGTTPGQTGGAGFAVEVGADYRHVWESRDETSELVVKKEVTTYELLVPPKRYGFIALTPVIEKLTGTFTFSRNSWDEWTYTTPTHIESVVSDNFSYGGTTINATVRTKRDSISRCGGLTSYPQGLSTYPTTPLPRGAIKIISPKTATTPAKTMCIRGTSTDGAAVYITSQMWDCSSWKADVGSGPHHGVVNLAGKCLDIENARTTDGARVITYPCTGKPNQQWIARSDGSLYNPVSGKCLDVPGKATADGTELAIYSCWRENWNQIWNIEF
ncbi:RICIN domain-containing protein [Streptomyces sp. NBC_00322]|uniref:RICIN domain-containing protein n=1 Tax=Streptomyces sp. NBC_00322 TaxID=2975712 RepID=UPI002E2B3A71|nr:RICIN domain-containing protein [Streptomyces sp. NBC_00322]